MTSHNYFALLCVKPKSTVWEMFQSSNVICSWFLCMKIIFYSLPVILDLYVMIGIEPSLSIVCCLTHTLGKMVCQKSLEAPLLGPSDVPFSRGHVWDSIRCSNGLNPLIITYRHGDPLFWKSIRFCRNALQEGIRQILSKCPRGGHSTDLLWTWFRNVDLTNLN